MTPAALAALHAAAFIQSRAWSEDEFASLLAQAGTILHGDDHCFALFRVTLDEAELLTLATHPQHRRRGLAGRIVLAGEGLAHTAGGRHVFLEVAEDNAPACALYAALGYRQVGRRPAYYPRSDRSAAAALILRKPLIGA